MIEILIRCCAGTGLVITLFFFALQYRIIPPDHPHIPRWCRIDAGTCRSLLALPEAHIFGISNLFFAFGYYVAALVLPLHPWEAFFLISTMFAACLGVYLTSVLVRKLKIFCILCLTVHALNVALVILFIIHASQWHGL
ncbi:MAG: hypothetical protein NTV54_09375 [Ignavibacteriales bacterium]|nr:hypothetical protein [Ignavibacteriales bacterium]